MDGDKIMIIVKDFFQNKDSLFSRSEARRLINHAISNKDNILNFCDIQNISPSFAHELFIVNTDLDFKLCCVNTSVFNMIQRVKNTI